MVTATRTPCVLPDYYTRTPAPGGPRPGRRLPSWALTTPLTIVAMTTVLGFSAFLVNSIPSIRDLGISADQGDAPAGSPLLTFVRVPRTLAPPTEAVS